MDMTEEHSLTQASRPTQANRWAFWGIGAGGLGIVANLVTDPILSLTTGADPAGQRQRELPGPAAHIRHHVCGPQPEHPDQRPGEGRRYPGGTWRGTRRSRHRNSRPSSQRAQPLPARPAGSAHSERAD